MSTFDPSLVQLIGILKNTGILPDITKKQLKIFLIQQGRSYSIAIAGLEEDLKKGFIFGDIFIPSTDIEQGIQEQIEALKQKGIDVVYCGKSDQYPDLKSFRAQIVTFEQAFVKAETTRKYIDIGKRLNPHTKY